ncbi:hypothetical protein FKM82_017889 [Ascaphus truei]
MSNRRLVELFYDVVSPYSWLGFEVLCRYRSIWNVDIRLRPAFLGGIMSASGNSPPALVPKKAAYMVKDLERQAEFYQVPVRQPKDFFQVVIKKGSLSAMRFVTAVQMSHPEFLEQVSRELWLRIWSEVSVTSLIVVSRGRNEPAVVQNASNNSTEHMLTNSALTAKHCFYPAL